MKKIGLCISIIVVMYVFLFSIKSNKNIYQEVDIDSYKDKLAIMIEKDGTYEVSKSIPTSGYQFNEEKSKCSNGEKLSYSNNSLKISGLDKDNTSCYLYFDESVSKKVLGELGFDSKGETNNFDGIACDDSSCTYQENGVYEVEDDFGISYYFRGKVDNNWVKFGTDSNQKDIYWRIIRINGDGTIRLIYAGITKEDGSAPESTGAGTQISTTSVWAMDSSTYNNNMYVGYEWISGNMHGYGPGATQSKALQNLNTWFTTNLGDEWKSGNGRINPNAGFCNDRSGSTSSGASWSESMQDSGGTSTTTTYYGAYLRLVNSNKQPTLKCSTTYINGDSTINKNKDYFTYTGATGIDSTANGKITGTKSLEYPVGLITADEVAFAGGVYGQNNEGYWLNTKSNYWTMSPYYFYGAYARVFLVDSGGPLTYNRVNDTNGLRPVINLKPDTTFTFKHPDQSDKGTSTNPYIVATS